MQNGIMKLLNSKQAGKKKIPDNIWNYLKDNEQYG